MTDGHVTPWVDAAFQAVVKPGTHKIYLVAESPAVLRHVFEQYNLSVQRSCPMMQFGRRTVSDDATAMLQALKRDEPELIWIQRTGPISGRPLISCQGSSNFNCKGIGW